MINAEKARMVLAAIAKGDQLVAFDMSDFITIPGLWNRSAWMKPVCGTTCCYAGWTAYVFDCPYKKEIPNFAMGILGLTNREAEWLFGGLFTNKPIHEITLNDLTVAVEYLIAGNTDLTFDPV